MAGTTIYFNSCCTQKKKIKPSLIVGFLKGKAFCKTVLCKSDILRARTPHSLNLIAELPIVSAVQGLLPDLRPKKYLMLQL